METDGHLKCWPVGIIDGVGANTRHSKAMTDSVQHPEDDLVKLQQGLGETAGVQRLELSPRDAATFAQALIDIPKPTPRLIETIRNYRAITGR